MTLTQVKRPKRYYPDLAKRVVLQHPHEAPGMQLLLDGWLQGVRQPHPSAASATPASAIGICGSGNFVRVNLIPFDKLTTFFRTRLK